MEYFSRDLDKIDRAALPPLRRVGGPSLRVFPIAPLGPAIFYLITALGPTLSRRDLLGAIAGAHAGPEDGQIVVGRTPAHDKIITLGCWLAPHSCGQAGFGRKVARDTQSETVAPTGHKSLPGPNGSYGVEPVRKRLPA